MSGKVPSPNPEASSQKPMVWSGSRVFPDGTRRKDVDDERAPAPEGSPRVRVNGYSQPLHRHDVAVDFRDAEIPVYPNTHGKHIVGFAVGATLGSTTGAALGSALMAPNTVVGAALGAFLGGLLCGVGGFVLARYIQEQDEDQYWLRHHRSRPYYNPEYNFHRDYEPAYEFGYEIRHDNGGHTFEAMEDQIRPLWEKWRRNSRLEWDEARPAILDAWQRYDEVNAEHELKPQTF